MPVRPGGPVHTGRGGEHPAHPGPSQSTPGDGLWLSSHQAQLQEDTGGWHSTPEVHQVSKSRSCSRLQSPECIKQANCALTPARPTVHTGLARGPHGEGPAFPGSHGRDWAGGLGRVAGTPGAATTFYGPSVTLPDVPMSC